MKNILLVSIGYSPNIGGIETHFDDLTRELILKKFKVSVLTYKPLSTNVPAKHYERKGNLSIYRLPIFRGVFYKLVNKPALEFLYLTPLLFFSLPMLLALNPKIKTIDSHGLIAGFVSVFWGKLFSRKVITTTHSIYNFPENSLYTRFAKSIFNSSDKVLVLSSQSKKELVKIGVKSKKISQFRYWIDLEKFMPTKIRRKKFIVLFVGRLVEVKGIKVLVESAKEWNKSLPAQSDVILQIAGTGPLEDYVKSSQQSNIKYLGSVDNSKLPVVYNKASLLIMPSLNDEGFGRVILESLACGTPVIASNKGGIPEAMDTSVGELINPTQKEISKVVEKYYKNRDKLENLRKRAREFATNRYSNENAEKIIKAFK